MGPLCTPAQAVPCGSFATFTTEPSSFGVRSTGAPPAAGTVHKRSGVSTCVVVVANASVFPPSTQAIPAVAFSIPATRRAPDDAHTLISDRKSWLPIFGVCVTTASWEPSGDHASSVTDFTSGHHQAPSAPLTPTV